MFQRKSERESEKTIRAPVSALVAGGMDSSQLGGVVAIRRERTSGLS